MKKYLVFIISFILLLTIVQIGSGLLLTALYTSDFSLANQASEGGAVAGVPPIVSFGALVLTAALSYALSQKFGKKSSNQGRK